MPRKKKKAGLVSNGGGPENICRDPTKWKIKKKKHKTNTPKNRKKSVQNEFDECADHNSPENAGDQISKMANTCKKSVPSHIDQSDVTAVLMMMEGCTESTTNAAGPSGMQLQEIHEDIMSSEDDDDGAGDWEEVADASMSQSPKKGQNQAESVEITLDVPNFMKKKRKKEFDWMAFIQRKMRRHRKEARIDVHKTHFLCLLARGLYLSSVCNMAEIQANLLSLLPLQFVNRKWQHFTLDLLQNFLEWWKDHIIIKHQEVSDKLESSLVESAANKMAKDKTEYAMLLVAALRSIGLDVRLVMSLQTFLLKEPWVNTKKQDKKKGKNTNTCSRENNHNNRGQGSKQTTNIIGAKRKISGESQREEKSKKHPSSRNCTTKQSKNTLSSKICVTSDNDEILSECDSDKDDDFVPDNGESSESEKEENKKSKGKKPARKRKSQKSNEAQNRNSECSDFEEDVPNFRNPNLLRKKPLTNNRKILSSESSESSSVVLETDCNEWPEVYLQSEQRWICVNWVKAELDAPYGIEHWATKPLQYVIAFDKDNGVKDVTRRYASNFLISTRLKRVDEDWIKESLHPFKCKNTKRSQQEDIELEDIILKQALPSKVSDYKNHPYFVLPRHLLKFEAIYPETAVPVGYLKGEPVYGRECVHVLHSRANWFKEGRAVRIGEEPYKMVKSRPSKKKPKLDPDQLDLELFGQWQTEQYIPPPVVNGKIPRNEYGNIEIHKPWMLPAGAVQIKDKPGLHIVAKKLEMDCVPAMVGWDTHCGYSHPILDGFVVCEENKDVLLAAWEEQEEIFKAKEAEKRKKRALDNWKLIIKGLLIRERLKRKFNLQDQESNCGDD